MPMGTSRRIEGRLRETERGFVVEVNGGGHWVLDMSPRKARPLVGQQVVVEGTRAGFNLLDVQEIAEAQASP